MVTGSSDATIWVDHRYTKIDLHFGTQPEDFAWLADSPDVPAPRLVAAYDPELKCRSLVTRAVTAPQRSVAALVNAEVEKFLSGFEAASAAHHRSDGYQFYFHYNLALHRLARIVELLRGDPLYLFLPKLLLSKRMPLDEQKHWRSLRGSLYLPEASGLKRCLAEQFVDTLTEAHKLYTIERSVDHAKTFLEAIIKRDMFFNVRDVADSFDGRLRPGVLFRSSTLTRWASEPELAGWLRENNIRTIIDLRTVDEMEHPNGRYPVELLSEIQYINVAMSGPPMPSHIVASPQQVGDAYIDIFKSERAAIRQAIRHIAEPEAGAVVVHCHVGKDRTGLVCATVAMLLGLPESDIVADYVISGQGVAAPAIERVLAWLRTEDAQAVMRDEGLDESVVDKLKGRLWAQ